MTRDELLAELQSCTEGDDLGANHCVADAALLRYINDPDITVAYMSIEKWYA